MDFFDRIQLITEKCLTHRAKKRRIKKEKRKTKNVVLDWIEAFLWAACMVLLLNQYLVQAYRIPSGSMVETLGVGDHVFVNKIAYGPELLPGFFKLPGFAQPKRNDIIIFENPSYISRGTAFDILQRVIYMLTLSLVDIDRDDSGDPKVHFLIKRAIGTAGDRFKTENGDMKISFAGEDRWVDEIEYIESRGWQHRIHRLMRQDQYPALIAAGRAAGWSDRGFMPSQQLINEAQHNMLYPDFFTHHGVRLETWRKADPGNEVFSVLLAKNRLGWYVPEGRVFPVGDNRENSRDGRSPEFGAVRVSKVLGRGMIIYWPFRRIGRII
ncbi:MAG: signal peptidase I [Treponema sp.]|jgi:signal peptidase I|nr:signal peptidase I [Treponema sp.]